jgi:hypothetical protein
MIIILAGLMTFSYIFHSKWFLIAFFVVLVISAIKEPVLAYVGWIMGYANFQYITNVTGIVAYYLLVPIIGFGVIVSLLRGGKHKIPPKIFLFSLGFFVIASITLLNTRDISNGSLSFFMFLVCLFILNAVIAATGENMKVLGVINQGIVLAALAAFISVAFTEGLFNSGRIGLGDNIRKLANIASPAVMILIAELILINGKKKMSILNDRFSKLTVIVFLIITIFTLIATVSRGAYLAVGLSVLVLFASYFITGKNGSTNKAKVILISILLVPILWLVIDVVGNYVSGNYLKRATVWTNNSRFDIWEAAYHQLDPFQKIIGAGFDSFRALANLTGIDHYAHSVYIDAYFTFGIAGIALLFMLIFHTVKLAIRKKSSFALAMTTLTVFLYATHGNISGSMDFWFLLALSYCSCAVSHMNDRSDTDTISELKQRKR